MPVLELLIWLPPPISLEIASGELRYRHEPLPFRDLNEFCIQTQDNRLLSVQF